MKNLKGFYELNELEGDDDYTPEEMKAHLQAFKDACDRLDFNGAFDIAQQEGLFGGDLEEYIDSRKNSGNAFDEMIKIYNDYKKVALKLSKLIKADMEEAQIDYGIPPRD